MRENALPTAMRHEVQAVLYTPDSVGTALLGLHVPKWQKRSDLNYHMLLGPTWTIAQIDKVIAAHFPTEDNQSEHSAINALVCKLHVHNNLCICRGLTSKCCPGFPHLPLEHAFCGEHGHWLMHCTEAQKLAHGYHSTSHGRSSAYDAIPNVYPSMASLH